MESYTSEEPFDASLFVSIRRLMRQDVFQEFSQSIQEELGQEKRGQKTPPQASNSDSDDDQPLRCESVDEQGGVASTESKSESDSEGRQEKLLLRKRSAKRSNDRMVNQSGNRRSCNPLVR